MNHELHDALKYLSQLLLRRPLLHAIYNQSMWIGESGILCRKGVNVNACGKHP